MRITKQPWLLAAMLLTACTMIGCGNEQTFDDNSVATLVLRASVGDASEPSSDACPNIDSKLVEGEGEGGYTDVQVDRAKTRAKERAEKAAHEDVKDQANESADQWCQDAADEKHGEGKVQCYAQDKTYDDPTYDEDGDGIYGEDQADNDNGNGDGAEDGATEENSGELDDGDNDGPTEDSNWETACNRHYPDTDLVDCDASTTGFKAFANYQAKIQQGVNVTCKEVKSDPPFEQ